MNELLWYASRATGVVSIALLTVVFILGLVTSGVRRPRGDSAAVVMGLHRALSLGMGVFLLAHIGTAIADTYVDIGWVSAVLPFTSGYAPLLVGLGTLAFDALLAVVVTSVFRHRLRERTWRGVHALSFALWPLAIIHGVGLGTSSEPLLRGVTVGCGAIGVGALVWRGITRDPHRDRRRRIAAQEWS